MEAKNWIAIGAASALSLGVMAAGAVTTANALPLIAGATNLGIPGITVGDLTDQPAELAVARLARVGRQPLERRLV